MGARGGEQAIAVGWLKMAVEATAGRGPRG